MINITIINGIIIIKGGVPINFNEIIITVPSAQTDIAGAIANMVVPYGIYIEDYSNLEKEVIEIANIDMIDESLIKKDRSKSKIHIYIDKEHSPIEAISFLKERYKSESIDFDISVQDMHEEDFANNWKKYFKPIEVGNKLLIRPIWEEYKEKTSRKILNLEPGIAFGTGTHQTTRLCLSMLEDVVNNESRVLDVGCGSGILAIASLVLGAKSALGVDIDELAVKTAVNNAKLNNVENRFNAVCGDLLDKVDGQYDIILANIVADVIINLSKDIKPYMHKDTIFLMSGIIDSRLLDVKNALNESFIILDERQDKCWVALKAKLK